MHPIFFKCSPKVFCTAKLQHILYSMPVCRQHFYDIIILAILYNYTFYYSIATACDDNICQASKFPFVHHFTLYYYCAITTVSSNQLQFPWGLTGACDTAVSCVHAVSSVYALCLTNVCYCHTQNLLMCVIVVHRIV